MTKDCNGCFGASNMNEHIAELFDKYCTARDCDTCKYNKDKRVVSGEIHCNKAYEDDYRKRYKYGYCKKYHNKVEEKHEQRL